MKYFFLLISTLFIFSCKINSEKNSSSESSVKIIRLDSTLMALQSVEAVQAFLKDNEAYARLLYRSYPDDTAFVNHLYYIIQHPETRKLHQETTRFFGNLADIEAELGAAFSKIKAAYPDFVPPKVVATFTGLENDLYVSDSVVYLSLESFIGTTASYRPQQPDYILQRYQKQYIVPTIIRFISDKYNVSSEADGTLLNDMLYFGKAFEFTKQMLPEGKDALVIAYPDSTMQQVWEAQDLIWAHFIDKQLLFEQNSRVKEKYIGERPKTIEIGPACPGRIGQWLGWRIVERYLNENESVTLQELMKTTNAQDILAKSKYRGQLDKE
jgi:Predicted Zn-dependent protease (DUF2268)